MSDKKHKGLGKGFDALMPGGVDSSLLGGDEERVQKLFIDKISPNPDQPRREFDENSLEELASSIRRYGVLQPLIVVPKSGEYQIIAGERRWRASKIAGLKKVPAIVKTIEELEQLEISIVENIQRVDLSPLEQAASISRLHNIFGVSYEDIAKRLNKAQSTVNNIARLLQLPEKAQEALKQGLITEGHARSILALKDLSEEQDKLLTLIQKNNWSVRQAEQFVVAAKSNVKDKKKKPENRTASVTPQTKHLSKVLNYPVSVNHMAKGGRLVIRFKSDDDLDALFSMLENVRNDGSK